MSTTTPDVARGSLSSVQSRRAAAAAEFALVLPFVSFLFAVALDFCRMFYVTQTLQSCADTAALVASGTAQFSSTLSREQAGRKAALADAITLDPPLREDQVIVTVSATEVTLTVQYEYQLLTSLLAGSSDIVLQRTATMALAPRPGD